MFNRKTSMAENKSNPELKEYLIPIDPPSVKAGYFRISKPSSNYGVSKEPS
jgi:hypothetical protein